jgi:hypothetical protein
MTDWKQCAQAHEMEVANEYLNFTSYTRAKGKPRKSHDNGPEI